MFLCAVNLIFNCCLFALNIISSGRRATAVLHNQTNDALKFLRVSRSHPKCRIILPPMSYNSSLPILRLSSSPSEAADERSRWFVLWLVSAPPSPLSDHLHLLQRRSALELCAHWTATHPDTGAVQNMPLLKLQLKRISK